jgi:DNA-binding XRE family transcriptional regulator
MSATHPLRHWRNKTGEFAEREGEAKNQDAFAGMVGVVPSQISQIETGERRPSLALAVKIAELTGIPVSDLAAFGKPKMEVAAE